MTSYRVPSSTTADSQAEQFRKYLETGGVLEVVHLALAELYAKEDKPENPLEYFKQQLGVTSPNARELDSLRNEVNRLSSQLEQTKLENQSLREQLNECNKSSNAEEAN